MSGLEQNSVNGTHNRLPDNIHQMLVDANKNFGICGSVLVAEKFADINLKVVDQLAYVLTSNLSESLKESSVKVLQLVAYNAKKLLPESKEPVP